MENTNNQKSEVQAQKSESDNSILMGILAYLGILVIIPYMVAKNKPFVKFHIKQGLVLAIIEIILWLGMRIFWIFIPIFAIVELGVLVLVIIGIINVSQKKEKELPLVGAFAKHINI